MFYFWNIRSFLYRTALTMTMFFENVQKSPLSNFSKPTYFAELTRMCYLFVHMDHWRHLLNSKELISVANPLMFVIICHIYLAKKILCRFNGNGHAYDCKECWLLGFVPP